MLASFQRACMMRTQHASVMLIRSLSNVPVAARSSGNSDTLVSHTQIALFVPISLILRTISVVGEPFEISTRQAWETVNSRKRRHVCSVSSRQGKG